MRLFLITILSLTLIGELYSTPEFSLWTGSSCVSCHVNRQGGGMRKEFGWTFGRDASLFQPAEAGLRWLYFLDKSKYHKFDSIFTYGTDFRLETFRSHKTPTAKRRIIPMQASLYANLHPYKWLTFEGQYNFGKLVFPGQTSWSASAILQPFPDLPALRIGRFQPSMGIRDCDMTSLDRRVATPDGTEIIIAPDYSEIGFELIYSSLDWLLVNAGAFDSRSLHEVSSNGVFGFESIVPVFNSPDMNFTHFFDPKKFIAESFNNNLSVTARVIVFPELGIEGFPAVYLGGSTMVNGRFVYNNAFFGIAVMDNLHTYFKWANSNSPYIRFTNSYIAGLTYMPLKGLLIGARVEHGISDWFLDNSAEKLSFITNQYVLNAKIFVLPYIELIPEYRYIATTEYSSLRWAFQLHLYY